MKKHVEDFLVCGISIRTNNQIEMSDQSQIKKLWEHFHKTDTINSIIHKVSDELIAVYSNYATDHTGEYDYLIGVEVKSLYQKEDLQTVKVRGGDYFHLQTLEGDAHVVVPQLWQNISAKSECDIDKKRSFVTDFEVYGKKITDPTFGIVDVYVGLCPAYSNFEKNIEQSTQLIG